MCDDAAFGCAAVCSGGGVPVHWHRLRRRRGVQSAPQRRSRRTPSKGAGRRSRGGRGRRRHGGCGAVRPSPPLTVSVNFRDRALQPSRTAAGRRRAAAEPRTAVDSIGLKWLWITILLELGSGERFKNVSFVSLAHRPYTATADEWDGGLGFEDDAVIAADGDGYECIDCVHVLLLPPQ